jgi:hypothetical protein
MSEEAGAKPCQTLKIRAESVTPFGYDVGLVDDKVPKRAITDGGI